MSSLVTSPSKRSIRFLSLRKPLESPAITPINTDRRTIPVVLTWDGMDQTKAPAEAGIYQFELRAKLLSNGEKAADAHAFLAKTRDTGGEVTRRDAWNISVTDPASSRRR